MAANPFFSGRISQELYNHIEKWREETKESKTDVLIRALAKYTNFELDEDKPSVPPIQEKLDEIFKRLEILENSRKPNDKKKNLPIAEKLKITSDKSVINFDDNQKITSDNKIQILSTKDAIALLGKGCSKSNLSKWKIGNELPKIKNGYQIEAEGRGKWKITKITKLDNNDN